MRFSSPTLFFGSGYDSFVIIFVFGDKCCVLGGLICTLDTQARYVFSLVIIIIILILIILIRILIMIIIIILIRTT